MRGNLSLDPEDDWSRLRTALHDKRQELIRTVVQGTLDQGAYQSMCGRIGQIGETLDLITRVLRGEDVKTPTYEPLRHVED